MVFRRQLTTAAGLIALTACGDHGTRLASGKKQATPTPKATPTSAPAEAKPVAQLEGLPATPNNLSAFQVRVTGENVAHYRFAVVDGTSCAQANYSDLKPAGDELQVSAAADGEKSLCVVGVSDEGLEQVAPPALFSWVRDTVSPTAEIAEEPKGNNAEKDLDAVVAGEGVVEYQFALVNGAECPEEGFSALRPVEQHINIPIGEDGPKALCVKGKDAAGNLQGMPTKAKWTKIPEAALATLTGLPADPSRDAQLAVTVGGAGITHYKHALVSGSSCIDAAYSAWIPVSNPIETAVGADGPKLLCVLGKNGLGRAQELPTYHQWIHDTAAPIAVLSGVPTSPSAATALAVNVSGDEVQDYQYKVVNSTSCTSGTYSTFRPKSERLGEAITGLGVKSLCVIARDAAGNVQATPTRYQWLREELVAVVTGAPALNSESTVTSLNVTIGGAGVSQYQFVLRGSDDCATATYSAFAPTSQKIVMGDLGADGLKILCVKAKNGTGTVQTTPTRHRWTKDTVAPRVVFVSAPEPVSRSLTFEVVLGGPGVTAYKIVFPQGTNSCTGAQFPATWTPVTTRFQLTPQNLMGDGDKVLCAKGRDAAGNEQADVTVHQWTKDTVAPTRVTLSGTPTATSTTLNVTVSGTGVERYQFALKEGAGCEEVSYGAEKPVATPITGSIGAAGPKTLCVRGIDGAGNIQVNPTTFSWTRQ